MTANFSVTGPQFGLDTAVLRTTITTALDNQGARLRAPPVAGTRGQGAISPNSFSSFRRSGRPLLELSVLLTNPAPTAASIAQLEGELEIYSPPADAIVEITNVLAWAGKPLEHPQLAERGIELILLTAETYPAVRERLSLPMGAETNFSLGNLRVALRGPDTFRLTSDWGVYLKNPDRRLLAYAFRDSAGNPLVLATNRTVVPPSPEGGSLIALRYVTPFPSDAKFVGYLNALGASTVVPFRFENVRLPRGPIVISVEE